MNTPLDLNRRDFLKRTALGTTALGAVAALQSPAPAADEAPKRPKRKTKIRVGTRINQGWMRSENDNDLRFLKQIGVDSVDIELGLIEGYNGTGFFTKDAFKKLMDRFDAVGLRIERANSTLPHYVKAHLALPEGQQEIDNLRKCAELVAEANIPVFAIQACQADAHVKSGPRASRTPQSGRGGYRYQLFEEEKTKQVKPAYQVTADQLWKGVINIYKQVMPTIEGSKTRLAMHGNDPPLYHYLGNPQILCRFKDLDRLMAEVPSKHNGVTFCVGTRYESGENVFDGIRHFGRQGKLFHVHFRNVRGTLPVNHAYSEVFVDDGDLDMAQVLRTLEEVNYDGVIDYDHPIGIAGDTRIAKQYISYVVGYMNGLLDSLPR
jgi:mannonate dehydratase